MSLYILSVFPMSLNRWHLNISLYMRSVSCVYVTSGVCMCSGVCTRAVGAAQTICCDLTFSHSIYISDSEAENNRPLQLRAQCILGN